MLLVVLLYGTKDLVNLTIFTQAGSAVQYVDLPNASMVVLVTRRGPFTYHTRREAWGPETTPHTEVL